MRILIIGSLAGALGSVATILKSLGFRIHHADTALSAVAVIRTTPTIDHALCDVAANVGELAALLQAQQLRVSLIACGNAAEPQVAAQAIRLGCRDFLELPTTRDILVLFLQALGQTDHALIAHDPKTLELLRSATQVAGSEASILIYGESGTGKEIFARHVHRSSKRATGPFVAVNCAAIPDNLLESELFGYEKGAFSGAVSRRIGKFEAADRGTLLLDEIGEIDVRLQAKLLRAIQEREIDRVGGNAPVRLNVRILATTNRDLAVEVQKGNFREDLYFRLNVISLHLPPLRARPGDIPTLAGYFSRKYADLNGIAYRDFTPQAMAALCARSWPGNIRELENTVHRSVLISPGPLLDIDPEAASDRRAVREPDATSAPGGTEEGIRGYVGRKLEDLERDLILETLEHTHGNRTHAATMLGISIRALRNKIREYAAKGVSVPHPQTSAFV